MSGHSYDVLLETQHIGWLIEHDDGRVGFRFTDAYREQGDRPILGQYFEDKGLSRTYWGKRVGQLPAFFANILPEGRLRKVLETSIGVGEHSDLEVLAAVAEDLPGALAMRPSGEPVRLDDAEGAVDRDDEQRGALRFRFSLAGVQLKFSMVNEGGRLALPARGQHGAWIVKIGTDAYPGLAENEHTMLAWARAAGFEVPQTLLMDASALGPRLRHHAPRDGRILAVGRYDRDGNRRLHQEDFLQVIGGSPERKYDFTYEQLIRVAGGILGREGGEEALRRLLLVVATGNTDAHLKNWSLLYRDGVTPSFSPLYDQVATIAWEAAGAQLALKLAGTQSLGRIDLAALQRLGQKAGLSADDVARISSETLARLRATWTKLLPEAAIYTAHVRALRAHWRRVPLLRAAGPLA